ncbi:uncharacterized protein LOC111043717 [Nilaparvata lugens]|uniref:uncharacterized protein LOC111043717 n=1 Tax=Nilaparvata lugens TaxID=108931 RepID=UPI00193EBF92|nr:uncharacterized protein LOC111043717 [Nilaparvata lugens]
MLMMREKCLAVEVFTWTLIVLLAVEAARGSSTPPPTAPSTTLTPQQERTGRQWNLNLAEADYIAIATFHKIAEQDMWKNLIEQTMPSSLVGEVIENFKAKYDFTGNGKYSIKFVYSCQYHGFECLLLFYSEVHFEPV